VDHTSLQIAARADSSPVGENVGWLPYPARLGVNHRRLIGSRRTRSSAGSSRRSGLSLNNQSSPSTRRSPSIRRQLPSGELLDSHGHILDGGKLIGFGHCPRGMPADAIPYPRLDSSTGCSALKGVPPGVVGLDSRVGDPKFPHPLGQPFAGLDCRAAVVGATGRSGWRPEEQRPLLPQATLDRLDVFLQTHLDQMRMYGDCAGLARLHGASIRGDAQDIAAGPMLDVLHPQLGPEPLCRRTAKAPTAWPLPKGP
jgi:hypothetical protein